MKSNLILKNYCLPCLALSLTAGSAFALGIRVCDQDARATARGDAFAATADNPSAIYYNPAGITQLEGVNARVGVYGIYLKDEYRGYAGTFDSRDSLGALPHFYATYTPKESRFSFGLGCYAPYGLALKWPDDTMLSLAGKSGELSYITINPVVAYKILDTLSLAAGPTINYSQVGLAQGLPGDPYYSSVIPGAQSKFKGDAWAVGASAGLLWKPHQQHAFGVTYRSATTMDWQGHSTASGVGPYSGRVGGQAKFDFPNTIVGGYSFRPTPKWNFEFNLDWTDWSSVKTVTVQNSPSYSPFLQSQSQPYDWRSSFMYEFGATRYFGDGWAVSAGYVFSENSVPDAHFSPTVPDSDRHIFAIGIGHTGKRVSWDLAYQFAHGPERTINNGGAASLANGKYTFISHAIALSVGYHF